MKRSPAAILFLASLISISVWAESSKPQAADSPARGGAAGQQMARASKEEAQGKDATQAVEDPNAQFRESPSVKWLAKTLNTTTERAFWGSMVLNFAVVATAIVWGWKKFVPAMLRLRTESIQRGMQEAARASEDANRRLREIETKLGQLGSEVSSLGAQAEAQTRDEEARLKATAQEEKQKIVAAAEQEIAAMSASARRELRSYAAALAVELAAKKINIDPSADQALVRDFAEQLGRNGK